MKIEKRTEQKQTFKMTPVTEEVEYEVYIVNGAEFKNKEKAESAQKFCDLLKCEMDAVGDCDTYRIFEVHNKEDIIFLFHEDTPEHRAESDLKRYEKQINELIFPCKIILETQIGYGDYDYGTTYTWRTFEEIEKEANDYIEEYANFKRMFNTE